jgi:glycosyltransferase involved in cell wall biosynthesis
MNMLFIPHVPNLNVINRVYEFAKNTDSYFLNWQMENSNFYAKVKSQINSLRYKKDGKIVQISLLFKPEGLGVKFNTANLNRLIDKLNIDVVINANALLFDIKNIKVPVVYDLVDDHLEVNESIGLTFKRVEKIKEDIKHSAGVICVSEFLEKKVKSINPNTVTIENGLYFEKFDKAKSLKKELNLEDKKVFGYIGGVDKWTGIDKAIENYLKIKNKNTAFLIVGGSESSFFKNLKEKYKNDVLFIGKVAPDVVADYFKTIDVGLIPFELNDFTNNALPIKALEYGYVKKPVISTPLKYLKYKNFPFIEFCDINEFYKCMQKDLEYKNFDFKEYDWKNLSKKLLEFVKESV